MTTKTIIFIAIVKYNRYNNVTALLTTF